MANPSEGRIRVPLEETWKKLWATPLRLDEEATQAAFEELTDALVPSHMRARFVKRFGVPKERFGNRFFVEGAVFRNWNAKLSQLGMEAAAVDVEVITATSNDLRGFRLRGQSHRALKDIVVDDSEAVCAIARCPQVALYILTEPGMKGCIVLVREPA